MNKKLRELQAKKAALVQSARAITDTADKESRDLTAEEIAEFDKIKAQIDASSGAIEREYALIAEEAQLGIQSALGVTVTDNNQNDATRGFRSFGEFARSVRAAADPANRAIDQRLSYNAAAPTTYNNEGSGADGGFAVPPQFSQEIWRMSLGEGSLLPMTANTEVSGNSMVFPKDETTPWSGAGVQAYWKNEGPAGTGSKFALGTEMLRLHELMVLVPVTNELMEDAPALGSYLEPLASERIQWKTNEAILFGTGAGQPYGCLNSGALITVAKETGQATQTILQPNISKMRAYLKTGELSNAVWIGNPDILPALEAMTVGQFPIFLPPGGMREGSPDGTLNGRPLILSEHAAAFSSAGDLNLVALKGYRTITKAGGVETATSMHLYFDANATAFRFIFRIDGKPIISKPITPPKSTNQRSYFLSLGAR